MNSALKVPRARRATPVLGAILGVVLSLSQRFRKPITAVFSESLQTQLAASYRALQSRLLTHREASHEP